MLYTESPESDVKPCGATTYGTTAINSRPLIARAKVSIVTLKLPQVRLCAAYNRRQWLPASCTHRISFLLSYAIPSRNNPESDELGAARVRVHRHLFDVWLCT